MNNVDVFIHPTVELEAGCKFGQKVRVWQYCHLREGVELGDEVSLGRSVFVDKGVKIGTGTRVQNGVSVYAGVHLADWCFVGPHVVFTNDLRPRSGVKTWEITETRIHTGAAIGAGSVIRCGIEIGAFAMIGAGAIVTKSVPPFHISVGFPSTNQQMICACGETVLPVHTLKTELIRDCCSKKLGDKVLERAKALLA